MTTHHTSGAADLPEALQSVTYFTAAEGAFGEACANAAPNTRIREIVWLDGRPDEVLLNDLHICVAVTNAGKMLVGYSRTNRAAARDAALAPPATDGGEDAGRLERERICAAIKAEDDYCVDHGDYMLDSDDCIKIVRGEWVRPSFSVDAARAPADSVQEDAARYRLLRRGQHWTVVDGTGDYLRAEALDAAIDAARKQGGA